MYKAAHAYLSTQVTTTSQGDLLLMLYDAAIKFLNRAKVHIEQRDYAQKGVLISKAMDIISELAQSLNREKGGDLAENLNQLYFYCSSKLLKANLRMDVSLIDEVIQILTGLRSAFAEIIPQQEGKGAQATIQSQNAGDNQNKANPSKPAGPQGPQAPPIQPGQQAFGSGGGAKLGPQPQSDQSQPPAGGLQGPAAAANPNQDKAAGYPARPKPAAAATPQPEAKPQAQPKPAAATTPQPESKPQPETTSQPEAQPQPGDQKDEAAGKDKKQAPVTPFPKQPGAGKPTGAPIRKRAANAYMNSH
jgi:flagellar protein FliS